MNKLFGFFILICLFLIGGCGRKDDEDEKTLISERLYIGVVSPLSISPISNDLQLAKTFITSLKDADTTGDLQDMTSRAKGLLDKLKTDTLNIEKKFTIDLSEDTGADAHGFAYDVLADNIIVSSLNYSLKTTMEDTDNAKTFKIDFIAYESIDKEGLIFYDRIYAKLDYPIFSTFINEDDKSMGYASFKSPVLCDIDSSGGGDVTWAVVPLERLRFTVEQKERRIAAVYTDDVDSFVEAKIADKIALVIIIPTADNEIRATALDLIDDLYEKVR